MYQKATGETLDHEGTTVDIPYTSNEALLEVVEVWLPLRDGGAISEDTFLSKIPGIDPEKEKAKIEAEEGNRADRFEEHKDRITS
jgi:hypothetical protein